MIDGCHDEASIGQRLLGVMVRAEPPAPAMREDHQRQLCAGDGTILHALQVELGADRKTTKLHLARLRRARIPDRA